MYECQPELEIVVCRGDLLYCPFIIELDGEKYQERMDEVFFTVKRHFYDKKAIIHKRLSNYTIDADAFGNYMITLLPEDTQQLPFGQYDFDIEVIKESFCKTTFNGVLYVVKESTDFNIEGASA